jgi:hypothetical protein
MQPSNPYGPAAPQPQPHEYEFIVNPGKPPRRSLNLLPTGAPPILRVIIAIGGLLVLLILFLIIKGFLSGGGNTDALTTVAQDQQQIIHLATNATQQTALSPDNLAFSETAQITMTSAQTQLVSYLRTNGHKVGVKTLSLKVSTNLDTELKTAAGNSTYNDTFKQTMRSQLNDYQQALREAYKQTSGPKGRKLLSNQFTGSQLLLQQLNAPAS